MSVKESYRSNVSSDDEEGLCTSSSDHDDSSNESHDRSSTDAEYADDGGMYQNDDNDDMVINFNVGLQKLHINPISQTKKLGTSKIDKNPRNLTADQVQAMIAEKKLLPGPPPDNKRCSSNHWKDEIMFFLYDAETGAEFEYWFFCAKCHWVHNCILSDGNKTIREHANKHRNERPYEFNRIQLATLLANATTYGASNGKIPATDLVKHLPLPDKW